MTIKAIAPLTLALLAASGCASSDRARGETYVVGAGDREAVVAALEDYVDGFTLGRPELLERSLSPRLAKKGYRRAATDGTYGEAIPLSYDDALALAARRAAQPPSADAIASSVEVFEVADKIAAGKITAPWGIDYVHLVKEDGRWRIHHVIWQTEPPRADG